MLRRLLLTLIAITASIPALATIEIKANYAIQQYDPSNLNKTWSSSLDLSQLTGLGLDATYSFIGDRLPIGIRYMQMEENLSASGKTRDFDFTRFDALIGYRFWLEGTYYISANLAVPVISDATYKDDDGSNPFKATSDTLSGTTVGIEGVYRLTKYTTIGAEIGQSMVTAKSFKSGGGSATYNSKAMEIELEGLYAHLSLGVLF